jgi:vacuolar-type H+-ATPase subunit I/STV1
MGVIAQVNEILGPDGSKLSESPIDVRLNVINEVREDIGEVSGIDKMREISELRKRAMEINQELQQLQGLQDADSTARKNDLRAEKAKLVDEIEALGKDLSVDMFTGASFSAGIVVGQLTQMLSLVQEQVDANEVYYQRLIDEQIALGNIAEAQELNNRLLEDKEALLQESKQLYEDIDTYISSGADVQKIFDAQKDSIKERYKDSGGLAQAMAEEASQGVIDSSMLDDTQKVQILTAFETGALDPNMIMGMLKLFEENEIRVSSFTHFSFLLPCPIYMCTKKYDNKTNRFA